MSYDGWKNYETWLAYTWLSNDKYLYQIACDAANYGYMGDFLENLLLADQPENGLVRDLLLKALERIDENEITEAFQTAEEER